jgi:exodeoxyribonuclease VII large subunit
MGDLFDLPFDDPDEPEPPAADEPVAAGPRVYSVSELTSEIRDLLGTTWPDVRVEGEISNLKISSLGHVYFTLKDERAQLRGVMFRSAARTLKFKLEDGQQVVAHGQIGVYEQRGEYQLLCEHVEPRGLGALQLALEQLKRRLQVEGLLDTARKRPLPTLPRRIGIVTSLTGAAVRDILKVLSRRYPNAQVVIAATRVQGDGASAEIARALGALGRVEGVDVVIVGRGGGSIEDLWAFNEEPVARAIARCPVPVISAVGHEVDITLADLVADLRAPTPSAAAELVVSAREEFVTRIDRLRQRARGAVDQRVRRARAAVHQLDARPAYAGFKGGLAMRGRHVAEVLAALERAARDAVVRRQRQYQGLRVRLDGLDLKRRMGRMQMRLARADAAMRTRLTERFHAANIRLQSAAGRLDSLSPLGVLGRGYALCWRADAQTLLRDAADVEPGDAVRITLRRGELDCTVTGRTEGGDELGGVRSSR